MTGYDNTNRGVLFENKYKDAPNKPDFRGKLNVDGGEYYISAWKKNSEKAGDFFSISVTPISNESSFVSQPPETTPQSSSANTPPATEPDLPF